MTNGKLIELFRSKLKEEDRSDNTIKNYVSDVNTFINYLEGVHEVTGLLYIQQTVLKEFINNLQKSGLAVTTINRRIQSLKTFYSILMEKGLLNENPMLKIKALKVAKQNETLWLDRNQVKRIFNVIDSQNVSDHVKYRVRAIISILVNCGVRVQELCDIKLEHLNWNNGLIEIIGKGNKYRKVPFNSATQRAVKRWLQYRDINTEYLFHTERSPKMSVRAVQHIVQGIAKELNFKLTVHQLRHTALKNIADVTGKIEIVASIAGHEDVNTSRRYIEFSLQEISEAMAESEFDF